jgi:HD superfamily phosphohydrolase
MNTFKKIRKALKSEENKEILNFNGFNITEKAGGGEQGLVLKIENRIKKQFALKFYKPRGSLDYQESGIKRFTREINILGSLNHKNIVKIYTGGIAIWNEEKQLWEIMEGFENHGKNTHEENVIYFYIMDYIEGKDISELFYLPDKENNEEFSDKILSKKQKLFEEMINQVSTAMYYYHSKNVTHKDIKPDNIRFCSEDQTFVIVDFGFARHMGSPPEEKMIRRTEYFDPASIKYNDYLLNDMGQFCLVLLKILPLFKDAYDKNRYKGLKNAIETGTDSNLEKRYKNMNELRESVSRFFIKKPVWRLSLKMNEHFCEDGFGRFDAKCRIPVSGSILWSKEVRRIVDTPEFQRLRGVKQLGPTNFIFPGANHTRFEHSLGAYYLSLRYLERLLDLPEANDLLRPVDLPETNDLSRPYDTSIKYVLLSALLHDIGHYPYSHWIEEIEKFPGNVTFPDHEDRARNILKKGEIKGILEKKWEVNVDTVCNIIANKQLDEGQLLVGSIVRSIIGVDKVDYLIRDSIHCGVDYGKGIDLERLLDSLYVNKDDKKLSLTEKGLSCLLAILNCRNIMYQQVYWHKTVRCCDAMFKRFFYEYVRNSDFDALEKLFNYSDDQFIHIMYQNTKNAEKLRSLISPFAFKGRSLYKPAYVYLYNDSEKEPNDTKNFFTKLRGYSYSDNINLSNKLVNALREYTEFCNIGEFDIILEKTPLREEHEMPKLDGIKIWNTRKSRYNNYPGVVESLNRYLHDNQQAYIFCHPKYYDSFKTLIRDRKLGKILGEIV